MSLADALSDGVADLDHYLDDGYREGWGEADPTTPWHAEVVACRNEMERLRAVIDANTFRPGEPEAWQLTYRAYVPPTDGGDDDA